MVDHHDGSLIIIIGTAKGETTTSERTDPDDHHHKLGLASALSQLLRGEPNEKR